VAVEGLFTWYWLADLWTQEGIPCVLGHALSMKAIHGGKATNDQSDAQQIAALLRGGMLPQAYGYPAERRATRDLLRRRLPLIRRYAVVEPCIKKGIDSRLGGETLCLSHCGYTSALCCILPTSRPVRL
jgi:transposase